MKKPYIKPQLIQHEVDELLDEVLTYIHMDEDLEKLDLLSRTTEFHLN